MKRNIAIGIFLIGVFTLSSCSTMKLASNPTVDNVYFSDAKAGDAPVYATQPAYTPQNDQAYSDDDDDYFYYDDYASRINRFDYASPFGYYDDFYSSYGYPYYNPFTIGFGYGNYGYGGWGLGYGSGYGYGGWGLGYGYGNYGYGGWGSGYYGLGGWGFYGSGGYVATGTPRPVRNINTPFGARGISPANSSATGIGYIPGGRDNTHRVTGNPLNNGTNPSNNTRPARTDVAPARPAVQQPAVERAPAPAPAASFSGGGESRGTSGSSGGGGARPSRP